MIHLFKFLTIFSKILHQQSVKLNLQNIFLYLKKTKND